jgi:uncharacterized membrane protein
VGPLDLQARWRVQAAGETLNRRIAAVDLVRGLIMVIMALDHTRDYFSNITLSPTDPVHSWPMLFFTRWITHLCAPGFVALAGTSVYLQRQRGRTQGEMGKKLVLRGLWLLFVEVAVVGFGIFFTYHFHFFQVIYAIGGSMIVLAALQWLPTRWVGAYGFAVLLLHDLLHRIQPESLGHGAVAWEFLVSTGFFFKGETPWIFVMYPLLPWSGVMALGYCFGAVVGLPAERRRVRSMQLGVVALVVFGVLRWTNWYGDSTPFRHLATKTQTAMSFLNVTKYPPSLQYLCVTLGVLLVVFAVADWALERRWIPRALGMVEVYGRVPFFYYVLHFYLLHVLALGTLMVAMGTVHVHPGLPFFSGPQPGASFSLGVVYAIWIGVVAALYWPCKWFAGVKARRRDWWLSYL